MRKLILVMLTVAAFFPALGQELVEATALDEARIMAKAYNDRNFALYADYMVPAQYGGKDDDIAKFALAIAKYSSTLGHLTILRLVNLLSVRGTHQALFDVTVNEKPAFIVGISTDNGRHWQFSQTLSKDSNFNLVLRIIPSFDLSFATSMDPRFGHRISLEVGQRMPSVAFVDMKRKIVAVPKNRIIVLNFWSITCEPCIVEMPQLNKLVEEMVGKDVAFIAPAFYSSPEQLHNFQKSHEFNYQWVTVKDPDNYDIIVFPTHVVIDRNQSIIFKVEGANPENLANLKKFIELAKTSKF